MAAKHFTAILALTLTLSACGGGGGGGASAPPVVNASPGGLWQGTDSTSNLQVLGIVDESGEAHFIRSDGAQYVATVITSGNNVSGTFQGFTNFGQTFPDGSTYGTGTLTGTVQQQQSFSANETFTTSAGSQTSGTLTLTFNSLYNSGSSLSTLSGNYSETVTGDVLSVTASGAATYQDPNNGCVLNGTIAIINASYDAYKVDFTLANCNGPDAVLNGVAFDGLGVYDGTTSPATFTAGVTGTSNGTEYALVDQFSRV